MTLDDVSGVTGRGSDREERREEHAVTRLEAFSDGVFAIAATLLVLDLTVSELGTVTSDGELFTQLVELAPALLSFVASFLILCLLWWLHVRAFGDIVRVDGVFVTLNCLRLLGVVLIPFTTSIDSTFTELASGSVYLAVNYSAVVIIGAVQTWYATSPARQLTHMTEAEAWVTKANALSAVILSLITVLLSPIVGSLAFLVFAFDPVLSRRLQGRPGSLTTG